MKFEKDVLTLAEYCNKKLQVKEDFPTFTKLQRYKDKDFYKLIKQLLYVKFPQKINQVTL